MVCANCGEELSQYKPYVLAGKNGSKYCDRQCAYEAYDGFYTAQQVYQTVREVKPTIQNKRVAASNEVRNAEATRVIIGQLLDTMKYASEKTNSLSKAGITVSALSEIENMIWEAIKTAAGMPSEERLGVWISDMWFDKAAEYCFNETSRNKAVGSILNWDKG